MSVVWLIQVLFHCQLNRKPMFYKAKSSQEHQKLQRGFEVTLNIGDSFGLLHNALWFEIIERHTSPETEPEHMAGEPSRGIKTEPNLPANVSPVWVPASASDAGRVGPLSDSSIESEPEGKAGESSKGIKRPYLPDYRNKFMVLKKPKLEDVKLPVTASTASTPDANTGRDGPTSGPSTADVKLEPPEPIAGPSGQCIARIAPSDSQGPNTPTPSSDASSYVVSDAEINQPDAPRVSCKCGVKCRRYHNHNQSFISFCSHWNIAKRILYK